MNIHQRIELKLGRSTSRKGGKEVIFACPWCSKKKMEINYSKVVYNCFRCGMKGHLKNLCEILGIQYEVGKLKLGNIKKAPRTLTSTVPIFNELGIVNHILEKGARDFLTGRGIDYMEAERYSICTSSNMKLAGRIIIPIFEDGKMVCYVARAIDGRLPKELAPKAEVASRSDFVFNIDFMHSVGVVIVEGIFDCMRLHRANYNAISIMGSNLSDVQLGKILAKKPTSIVLMYDGDEAGKLGWIKAHTKIRERCGLPIHVVRMPVGKDPDELTLTQLEGLLLTEWGVTTTPNRSSS